MIIGVKSPQVIRLCQVSCCVLFSEIRVRNSNFGEKLDPASLFKNIRYSAIIRGRIVSRIVGRIMAQYLTRPRVEYLYFRQIWRILVESSRIEPRYSCFRSIMGHSQIIMVGIHSTVGKWAKRMLDTTVETTIKFTIPLRLNLGHGHLVFALTTNLESGPH